MINGRLTYDEFCGELLLHVALIAEADFDAVVKSSEASQHVRGKFPISWIEEAVKDLIKGKYVVSRDYGDGLSLTKEGLREVEGATASNSTDFWAELDEFDASRRGLAMPNEVGNASVPPRVVVIDHMSDVFQGIETDIKETIRQIRSQNGLMNDPDAAQKVAELEAGSVLLSAPKADVDLLTRLLLGTLTWLMKQVGSEVTKALIKKLIEEITKWISSLS